MSEWAEDMRAMRDHNKDKKAKRRKTYTELIEFLAADLEFEYVKLTEYQFRITMKDGTKLDYYPTSGKATWVGTNKFFFIQDIEKFLTEN